MPKTVPYAQQRALDLLTLTKAQLSMLPSVCSEYIRSIEPVTQPLTRYVYCCDLRIFFEFLIREIPAFADKTLIEIDPGALASLTAPDISMYLEYLSFYTDSDDNVKMNHESGRLRKMSSLRSFFGYMYKRQYIQSDVTRLVDMPKRHEKPILRMEIDEVARMLDLAESGEGFDGRQKAYSENTRKRDLAILTLFLGTGIRVSELVGIDLSDIDFEVNGFTVTRKGGNQVILYFPDEVAEVLKEYEKERRQIEALPGHENALFLSLQKKRIGVRAVEVMVKKYATLAAPLKKRLSPHKLRSTYGTNLYRETGDIYLVADALGHSDVNTTRKHYAAMLEDRRKLAAQKIRLRSEPADGDPDPKE